jgi:hypothetical protein
LSIKEKPGVSEPFILERAGRCEEPLKPLISNACTSMSLLTRSISRHEPHVNDVKHGRKDAWAITQTQNDPKNKSKEAFIRMRPKSAHRRRSGIDYGRFVHGMMNVFAT